MSQQQGGYAAHLITIIVDGQIISGFADGDFFMADHDTDAATPFEGADGYVATADRPPMRLGHVELTVAQTSLANNQLSAIADLGGLVSIQAFNPEGGELVVMPFGKLQKGPPVTYGKEVKGKTYKFTGKLKINHAGFAVI